MFRSEKLTPVPALGTNVTPPQTPTTTSSAAHQLLSEIQAIHDSLSVLPSLAPCEQVNTLLTRLVSLSIATQTPVFESRFFSIPGVEQLCEQIRPICAAAEGELEKYWALKMLEQASSNCSENRDLLHSFPYYDNYIDLSRLEYSTLLAFLPSQAKTIAFIGSGPLPLTSLCMLDHLPTTMIINIDRDAGALSVSRKLCARLGYSERMRFVQEDVSQENEEQIKWDEFDVVFLAALVGTNTCSKMNILADLVKKLKVGTLVVARSAKGLRSILYPILELSSEMERIGLEILVEVHPWTKVVNSVIVFRVKEVCRS